MAKMWSILLLAVVSLLAAVESREVVCYYGTWAVYRDGDGQFTGDNVNPSLCTQLVYAFFEIDANGGIVDPDPNVSTDEFSMFAKFKALKQRNPALKTIAAVGGASAGPENFATVAANAQLRKKFAKNAVAFLRQYGFDGMDIDWEYPVEEDKANFVLLLKELANAFAPAKYLLTVAVGAPEGTASVSYDIPAISNIVNFINLMTYDMFDDYTVARHHAAINTGPVDTSDEDRMLNVEAVIKYWLSKGAAASKLNLGIPFYGHSYTLEDGSVNGVGAPATGEGSPGAFTDQAGFLAYFEICPADPFTQKKFDSVQNAAYAYSDTEWVSYDNALSIAKKCDVISKYGLAGGMVWSIDQDDFLGTCGSKFALLTALNNCVNKNLPRTTTTVKTTARPVTAKPTARPGSG